MHLRCTAWPFLPGLRRWYFPFTPFSQISSRGIKEPLWFLPLPLPLAAAAQHAPGRRLSPLLLPSHRLFPHLLLRANRRKFLKSALIAVANSFRHKLRRPPNGPGRVVARGQRRAGAPRPVGLWANAAATVPQHASLSQGEVGSRVAHRTV